jgi:hypothetical protein
MLSRKLLHAAVPAFELLASPHFIARLCENPHSSIDCDHNSKISAPADRTWHAACNTYATVEEWDGGPSQPRAGASIRDGAAGVQQMSSRFNNFGLPDGSPHFSPPEGRRGLPHLVGPSFFPSRTDNLSVRPLIASPGGELDGQIVRPTGVQSSSYQYPPADVYQYDRSVVEFG